jgi:methionyl aminopeptidase
MYAAINACKPGTRYNQIGEIITEYAKAHGFYVNEEFGGHGIAHHLHMAPLVHHNVTKDACKEEMRPGHAFTIEPILMTSSRFNYKQFKDGWTIQAQGVPSC